MTRIIKMMVIIERKSGTPFFFNHKKSGEKIAVIKTASSRITIIELAAFNPAMMITIEGATSQKRLTRSLKWRLEESIFSSVSVSRCGRSENSFRQFGINHQQSVPFSADQFDAVENFVH